MDSKNQQLTHVGQIIQNKQFAKLCKLLKPFIFKSINSRLSIFNRTSPNDIGVGRSMRTIDFLLSNNIISFAHEQNYLSQVYSENKKL